MRDIKLPSISDIALESKEERIIHYRKFFAELRLNRLYFQLSILKFEEVPKFSTPEKIEPAATAALSWI